MTSSRKRHYTRQILQALREAADVLEADLDELDSDELEGVWRAVQGISRATRLSMMDMNREPVVDYALRMALKEYADMLRRDTD